MRRVTVTDLRKADSHTFLIAWFQIRYRKTDMPSAETLHADLIKENRLVWAYRLLLTMPFWYARRVCLRFPKACDAAVSFFNRTAEA